MNGILLACQISSIRTLKDGSVNVALETQELSSGRAGELFALRNRIAAVYISPKETIDQKEIDQVDKVDAEFNGKTQSQRMRNVFFKLFDQDREGHKSFDAYYKAKTEAIIEQLKRRIKP